MSVILFRDGAAATLLVHAFCALCCFVFCYPVVRRDAANARKRLSYRRYKCRLVTALLSLFGALPLAQADCFDRAGTFGSLTVTTAGSGCGTFLNFGGITGLWLGDANVDESCTFNFAPALTSSTIQVQITAHSYITGHREEARFSINGSHYVVAPGERAGPRN